MTGESFADELTRRRERLNLTRGELAVLMQTGKATLADWERGRHAPTYLTQLGARAVLDSLEADLTVQLVEERYSWTS